MPKVKRGGFVFIALVLLFFFFFFLIYSYYRNNSKATSPLLSLVIKTTPTPTLYQFPYKSPLITKNNSYRIVIVGDSIVGSLGINANLLRLKLIEHYPSSEFVTYNYGYGSTNILSLVKRLTETSNFNGQENPAILKQGFELIILESFGYNPPSEFPLPDGLQKQNAILEESVRLILSEKPNVALVFMTPIAMDRANFARGKYDLSKSQREAWVDERISYINNHKRFAEEEKGIPVIDVYKASLNSQGEVDRSYIANDFIHPSVKGVELISKVIADFIYENKIFPE